MRVANRHAATLAVCFGLAAPGFAQAHGAIGLVNPPPGWHQRPPPAIHQRPLPHYPGVTEPAVPRYQPQSPFMPPQPPQGYPAPGPYGWHGNPQPPSIIYSEPSLRDRRLFEEELRLRQWHERELRRQHGTADRNRWHDHRRDDYRHR